MSLLSDLKKILFGAKSVARERTRDLSEKAKQTGEELKRKSSEYQERARGEADRVEEELRQIGRESSERARSALEGFAEKFREEADYAVERSKELKQRAEEWLRQQEQKHTRNQFAADFETPDRPAESDDEDNPLSEREEPKNMHTDPYGDFFDENKKEDEPAKQEPPAEPIDFEAGVEDQEVPKAPREPSELEKMGDQLLDKAARTGHEAKQAAERAGRKLMDFSEKLGGKILDRAEELGDRLKHERDDLFERAQREREQHDLDETLRQAKEMEERLEARKRAFDDKGSERDASDSTLSGTDSFFDRAARFAEGDYHNEGGKDMNIQSDPEYQPKERPNKIHGFEDRDGDGDDLIDDAIIDEDDRPKS